MKNIDVCLSPELLSLYDLAPQTVVVVDILRATSSMVTAFAHGVAKIKPVAHPDACRALRRAGYLTAGERNGVTIEDFDLGNSPVDYQQGTLRGKPLVMTTTNGTQAIEQSRTARRLVIGAFLNLRAVADYLVEQDHDVLVVCAGWKGHVNLEDTLFAGALINRLEAHFQVASDAALAASVLYQAAQSDLTEFLSQSSHAQRLVRLNIQRDIAFCLQVDRYEVVPWLKGDHLVVGN